MPTYFRGLSPFSKRLRTISIECTFAFQCDHIFLSTQSSHPTNHPFLRVNCNVLLHQILRDEYHPELVPLQKLLGRNYYHDLPNPSAPNPCCLRDDSTNHIAISCDPIFAAIVFHSANQKI